jgi:hypothetical protein
MDRSFREQVPGTQQKPKRFLVSLTILASHLMRLASLIWLTEEEREEAGIYLDRPGGE